MECSVKTENKHAGFTSVLKHSFFIDFLLVHLT